MPSLKGLRAVFMGTPEFAARILKKVLADEFVDVVAVYSQPDKPAGRGNKIQQSPVKKVALEHNIPVEQPVSFKNDSDVLALKSYNPDVLLVAAYGLILPEKVLEIPKILPINVHASLLPLYRGAAPIQRAIMDECKVTGITIMHMQKGLDTGPILLQRAVAISVDDTSEDLHNELADVGGDLLVEALKKLVAGKLKSIPQEDAKASYAAKLLKVESIVSFNQNPISLHAKIRGLTPWPGTTLNLIKQDGEFLSVQALPGEFFLDSNLPENFSYSNQLASGSIAGVYNDMLLVRCFEGWYGFKQLKPSGKSFMDGKAFFNGYVKDISNPSFSV